MREGNNKLLDYYGFTSLWYISSYQDWYYIVTMCTPWNFIMLPHEEIRPQAPWYASQSHYLYTNLSSPCPILIMLSARKRQVLIIYVIGLTRLQTRWERPPVKVWIIRLILHSDTFAVWVIFHSNWSIKGCGMCYPVCGKVHIKYPLLLVRKSSLCDDSMFPLKKYVTMTIRLMSNGRWRENQCAR